MKFIKYSLPVVITFLLSSCGFFQAMTGKGKTWVEPGLNPATQPHSTINVDTRIQGRSHTSLSTIDSAPVGPKLTVGKAVKNMTMSAFSNQQITDYKVKSGTRELKTIYATTRGRDSKGYYVVSKATTIKANLQPGKTYELKSSAYIPEKKYSFQKYRGIVIPTLKDTTTGKNIKTTAVKN